MKKLMFAALGLFLFGQIYSQSCTPDTTLADSVIISPLPFHAELNPEGGITDTAFVNSYYAFAFTFKPPPTYLTDFGEVALISVDLATEGAVLNMPPSFDYICNPPDCIFEADSLGCLLIFGTPVDGEEDVYDLGINATIQVGLPLTLTFPNEAIAAGNYYLHVKPPPPVSTTNLLDQQMSLKINPNPFGELAQIEIISAVSGNFDFVVNDLMGATVHREFLHLQEGTNLLPFDGSQLAEGIYFYSITDGKNVLSGKMLVQRN